MAKKLIPKAQFGTGLVKRGLRWLSKHTAPTQEQTQFRNTQSQLKAKEKTIITDDPEVLQTRLKQLGYYKGNIDRKVGPMTRAAIQAAERDGYKIKYSPKQLVPKAPKSEEKENKIARVVNSFFGKKVPTKEEYIEQRKQEVREKAAKINEETVTPYFPLGNYMPKHDFDFYGKGEEGKGKAKNMTQEQVRDLFIGYRDEAQRYLDSHPNISSEARKKVQRNINYYDRVIKDPQTVSRKGSGIGFGCIYSASGAFDQEDLSSARRGKVVFANNRQLAQSIKNNSDSPYEILPWKGTKLKVGDIIQIGTSDSKIGPHHAVMVTGFNMFGIPQITQTNAGEAGMNDRDIGSTTKYIYTLLAGRFGDGDPNTPGTQPQGLQIVRFKGDSQDIKQWEKEYNSIYKGDRK